MSALYCSDNDDVSSTSMINADCSPRWIVYPESYTGSGALLENITQRQCLDTCVAYAKCITAQWNSDDNNCEIHDVRPGIGERRHRLNSTQFDIVRQCNSTSGT